MKFLLLFLPLLVLALAVFGPLLDLGQSRAARERAVSVRLTLLSWMTAACLVAGLVFIPDKGRVLLLLPVWALLSGTRVFWRRRLRAQGPPVDVEGMKRAKPARGNVSGEVR